MLTKNNPLELLVDSHHGQFSGQVFAETIKRELFETITAEDWAILETGPDHELYNEVCADLDRHSTADGVSLWWSEGDLWAVDWSLIGDADELSDIGDRAVAELESDPESWSLFCDLRANLYDGPDHGRWSADLLREMRERVELIADRISDRLPRYVSTWCGIEELRVDVEQEMINSSSGLKELSAYW
jgi:hypothetical protein